MHTIIFMWKHTGIAALIFYQELSSSKEKVLCPNLLKRWKRTQPDRTWLLFSFEESSVNNIKVLATFYENLVSYILKKTI